MENLNIKMIDGKAFVELPCKPGDTVYYVAPDYRMNSDGTHFIDLDIHEAVYDAEDIINRFFWFGTTIFATYEEALKSLEAMKKEMGKD